MSETAPTHRAILRLAWPVILANSAVPLLGIADTAVLGHHGGVIELGAIALGTLIFSFIYWSFGFLRMATTGFTAQAVGARDEPEVRATLLRSLTLGLLLGLGLVTLGIPLRAVAFWLLHASSGVEGVASDYFRTRLWGAPATLGGYALTGCFIGLGKTRHLAALQLFLNAFNIALDVYFAGVLDWGAQGIALGTVIAEWTTLLLSGSVVLHLLRQRHDDAEPLLPWRRSLDPERLRRVVSSNADIMLRSLTLLFGFAWFTNQGASLGDVTLAANHLLLQLLTFSAFFLDGFAFVAESLVGTCIGAREPARFALVVRRTSELSGVSALLLALGAYGLGPSIVRSLTDARSVQLAADQVLPLASLYILLGFLAFQLDGIFIGATRTRAMRNAALASLAVFVIAWWPLTEWLGNRGLWLSFVVYVVARAVTLALYYPALARSVER